jgi:hypothetical protein
MVITACHERNLRAVLKTECHPRAGLYSPYPDQWTTKLRLQYRLEGSKNARRSCEAELKVLSAMQGKCQYVGLQGGGNLLHVCSDRNAGRLKLCPYATGLTNMA